MEIPYQQYFDAMPCYLTVQDRDFRIIMANKRFRDNFGENYKGRNCFQVYKHRAEKCEMCPVDRTFRDGGCHGSEEHVVSLDGRNITVIVNTMPIYDETGNLTSVIEMSTDITEIKLLQQQLRESTDRYRTLFEEVPCFISIQDKDLNIVEANRQFRENFGEFLGCKCYETYKHRNEECVECSVQAAFEDGKIHSSEEVVTSRAGDPINVVVYSAPIRNSKGDISGVMEMSTDITQIRQLQSQLTSLGLLISSISHGLKGLINSLDGGIYLLNSGLEKNNPDRTKQGWQMVQRNLSRIRKMVLDILYYAKDREPVWETVSALEIAEDLCESLQSRAQEVGVDFKKELDPNAGRFDADPNALRSLFVNLVENCFDACRVDSKKQDHTVSLRLKGDEDHVLFEVEDNGIGMDDETREKAFSLFFSSKGTEGTGLGLYISNKIAKTHGGSIQLTSAPDKGTRFIVKIPRKRQQTSGQ